MTSRGVLLAAVLALSWSLAGGVSRADIYDWRTGAVIPGTEQVVAGSGLMVAVDAPFGDFRAADLTKSVWYDSNLTGAKFNSANLNGGYFYEVNLAGADFTGADITFASFVETTSFTAAQLATTANYAYRSLVGVTPGGLDLRGLDFTRFDLRGSMLSDCDLSGVPMTGALVEGVSFPVFGSAQGVSLETLYSTASYRTGFMRGMSIQGDIRGANFAGKNLSGGALSANMAGGHFEGTQFAGTQFNPLGAAGGMMDDTHFDGANIDGAMFYAVTRQGFTKANLYSTASYQRQSLGAVIFDSNDLHEWNFAGQDLVGARFTWNDLSGADFTGAKIDRGTFIAYSARGSLTAAQLASTATYAGGDLSGLVLTNADLRGLSLRNKTLRGAAFWGVDFRGVDFTGAEIGQASFVGAPPAADPFPDASADLGRKNLTPAQLATTASYGRHDLRGLRLDWADFTDADLSGQNLRQAFLYNVNLQRASFRGADLRDARAYTSEAGGMAGSDYSFADLRGSVVIPSGVNGSRGINLRNTILADGSITGLTVGSGERMAVRNDPRGVRISDRLEVGQGGTLAVVLSPEASWAGAEAGAATALWWRPIQVEWNTLMSLGGTLEIQLADGVDAYELVGQSFDLFDWGTVPRATSNRFEAVVGNLPAGLWWDVSGLYSSGVVTLVPEPGNLTLMGAVFVGGLVRRRR